MVKQVGRSQINFYDVDFTPAAHYLTRSFVKALGLKAYHAYVQALKDGQVADESWDWKKVAGSFVKNLKMVEVSAF